ncbi:MAG: hypothetical protein OXF93_21325 [Acidobacteria bacterium]|nr:hypothetical protein [Acidobacteriota bacterium]
MNRRLLPSFGAALAVLALVALAPAAEAQTEADPPRLPWGAPDLQGVWDFRTITPLQRPEDQADAAFLTDEEAAGLEQAAENRFAELNAPSEVRTEPLPAGGGGRAVGAYNDFWFDRGTNVIEDRRTSLIVAPPNGRLPPLVQGAVEQIGSGTEDLPGERPVRYRAGGIGADGPEDRGLGERCLLGFNSGPPMIPSAYNNNVQLFQTESHVVILNEMVHNSRVVPLDGRPHLPRGVRQWMGDARGYWDGDTLVVETTNFTSLTPSFNPTITGSVGTGTTLTLTERFTRVDADTLLYEYTVDDPATFTSPFSAAIPMRLSDGLIYEYACHEGNYGMQNILAGARAAERSVQD